MIVQVSPVIIPQSVYDSYFAYQQNTASPHYKAAEGRALAAVPSFQPIALSIPNARGLQVIEAELMDGDHRRADYHSGFWVRDEAYLRSGPDITVNRDYFKIDGRPVAVVGTTYMSSEVQRLYFEHPNVYAWDRDLAQIHDAGLNMIRTGWWTGWDKFCDENGQPYERTLRTLEAYLMTAHKNGLPVQFNFFAFLPDALGGVNSYVDPEAVRKQQTLISAIVARFRDVPSLAWDLINEPSISQHLWTMRPNGDALEAAKWNQWLARRYADRRSLLAAWNFNCALYGRGLLYDKTAAVNTTGCESYERRILRLASFPSLFRLPAIQAFSAHRCSQTNVSTLQLDGKSDRLVFGRHTTRRHS